MFTSFSSLVRNARIGARTLLKSPGFLVTAVLSLGLGIGAGASAFAVIDAVRFRALPFAGGDRLALVSEIPIPASGGEAALAAARTACGTTCDVSYVTYENLLATRAFQTVGVVAAYTTGLKALTKGGEPIVVRGAVASPSLFRLLDVSPVIGRPMSVEDDRLGVPLVVLISHDLWANELGADPAIVGQTIKLSDSQYTVIGVMPPGFHHEVGNRFWLPAVPTLDPSTRPSIRSVTVIARLKPGRTLAQLQAELATIAVPAPEGMAPGVAGVRLEARPLRDRYTASTRSHDLVLAVIVACVLLIAATNVANLVLVRSLHQQREFGVRAALGAGRGRLAGELLIQHGILIAVSLAAGLLFARWFLGGLSSLAVLDSIRPSGMEYRLDGRAVGVAVLLAAAAGVLLSLVPARLAAGARVAEAFREAAPSSGAGRLGSRVQRGFVVAQIASAVVLLIGAGLMTKTVLRLSRLDLGFAPGRLVQGTPSYPHPWRVPERYLPVTRRIAALLAALPGAASVAYQANAPLGSRGGGVTLAGQDGPLSPDQAPRSAVSVSPGYVETLGATRLRGRGFTEQDSEAAPPVAMVNDWAARHWWPGADPIGRTFRVDTAPGQPVEITVVGVIADHKAARGNLLLSEDGPEVYRPYLQAPSAFPTFLVRAAAAPAGLLKPMRDLLVGAVPDRPVSAVLVADQVAEQLGGVRVTALQILGFAVVGFGLALVGIHGVLAYAVGRRTREIGIRAALGATRGELRRMVVMDAARLVGIGLVFGIPAALFATKLIGDLLHGTSPTDPAVFAAVGVVVAAVSLLASAIPARRAAKVEPAIALRDA